MATAERNYDVESVTLKLTVDEAAMLEEAMSMVGGHPISTYRYLADNVFTALRDIGFAHEVLKNRRYLASTLIKALDREEIQL